jgi:copper chaperone CopZ
MLYKPLPPMTPIVAFMDSLIWGLTFTLHHFILNSCSSNAHKESSMTTTSYHVAGISCDHCVRAITAEVTDIAGVRTVSVDIPTKTVTIEHADVAAPVLIAAINEAGFDEVVAK